MDTSHAGSANEQQAGKGTEGDSHSTFTGAHQQPAPDPRKGQEGRSKLLFGGSGETKVRRGGKHRLIAHRQHPHTVHAQICCGAVE